MSENKTPLTEKEEEIKAEQNPAENEEAKRNEQQKDEKKAKSSKRRKGKKSEKPESEMTEEEKKEAANKKKNKPKDAKGSAKRLIGYITKQKVWLIVVAVLVILSTVVTVCSSLIMKPVYEAIESVLKGAEANAAFTKITQALF
ncbi:MAG: hypothetical protein ACI4XE_00670, partial [Acutalibacteraceae bacterium]